MRRMLSAVLALVLVSCSGGERPLCIVGSSCMGKALRTLALDSPVPVEIQLGGTQQGLSALSEGRADLAACSRALTPQDGVSDAVPIALDAIAVIVSDENPLTDIDRDALRAVYEGEITDWSELGGTKGRIVVIGRESGSGTRAVFEQALGIHSPCHSQELGEDGVVCTAVSMCPRAIGYASATQETTGVHALSIGGVGIESETVQSGAYPLVRPFLLCKNGDDPRVDAFLHWATDGEAQAILASIGLFSPLEAP